MANHEISRRTFLKLGVSAGGLFMFGGLKNLQTAAAETVEKKRLQFQDVERLALRIDRLYDHLPDYQIELTPEIIQDLVDIFVPEYKNIGLITIPKYPDIVTFNNFRTTIKNLNIDPTNIDGNTPECKTEIDLNAGYTNPMSERFKDLGGVLTLRHELAHVQQGEGICKMGFLYGGKIETDAVASGPPIYAELIDRGNKVTEIKKLSMCCLLTELEDLSMNSAKFLALTDKKLMPRYTWLTSVVYSKATEQANLAYIDSIVRDFEEEHKAFLQYYNFDPLNDLMMGHIYGQDKVKDMLFPRKTMNIGALGYLLTGNHLEKISHQILYEGT